MVTTALPAAPHERRRRSHRGRVPRWTAVAFAAPLLLYLILFYAYPLVRNVDLSVHDYTIRAFVQGDAAQTRRASRGA